MDRDENLEKTDESESDEDLNVILGDIELEDSSTTAESPEDAN